MKNLQELAQMPGDERRAYLEQHKAEITLEWLQAAKEDNEELLYKDPAQALQRADIILQAAQVSDDPLCLALAHWALGNAYMFDDRPHEAIASFEEAVRLYTAADHPLDVARVELSRMAAETDRGYPDHALEIARRIGPILEGSSEAQDRKRLGILACNAGIALELQGDYEAALEAYCRWQKIIREITPDDEVQVARAEQNCALALTKLNRFDEAEKAYRAALEVLERRNVISDVVRVYTGLGWMHDLAGHDEQATQAFAHAHDWLARLSGEESLQAADLALFELKWRLKRDPTAVVAAAAGLRQAYAERSFSFAQEAALLEARARLQTGDTAGARQVCAEVEQALGGRPLAGLLWQVHHLTGQAWQQEGDLAQARAHYEKALEMIERDQRRIADVELRASALSDKLAVYQDLAALLVHEHDYDAALQVIERSKARALVDALQARLEDILPHDQDDPAVQRLLDELRALRADLDRRYRQQGSALAGEGEVRGAVLDASAEITRLERAYVEQARQLSRLDPGYGTVLGTHVASTAEIQETLLHDALLVEYYTVRGQLSVLVLAPDGTISHYSLGQMAEVERLVEQLPHRSLKSPDGRVWTALYDRLVAPWASALAGVRHLVVVPDGALHYVPFQALRCQGTGRYLIEEHEVSYAPSATLLVLTGRMRPVRRDFALVLGYDGGQLAHVPAEMGVIVGAFSGLTMFSGDQASRERLEAFASQADVIHIAAHGDFRSDAPLFSFVALADGRWQVADVYRQRLRASLVTLGACQTGRGRLTGGDLIGFAHALFYAGAQAVLVSLWPIHDASTAVLMAALYRGVRQGQCKAAALRHAQLALLHSEQWSAPLYWAPFCLLGADGIVGAAGLMRAVRRVAESGELPLAESQALLDRLTQAMQAYRWPDDQRDPAAPFVAAVETGSQLESLLATTAVGHLDLDQMAVQVGQAARELIEWRWPSAERMEEVAEGERPSGKATPSEPPTENETILQARQAAERLREWRWLPAKQMKEVAEGQQSVGEVTPSQFPTYNETIAEALQLRRALSEIVSGIHQALSAERKSHVNVNDAKS
jgi:CHAT domain-containing protein